MKKFTLVVLSVLTSTIAFANAGAKNIMTCSDQKNRVVVIEKLTGLTGGSNGDLIVNVQSSEGKLLIAAPVTFEHFDVTYPASYTGKNLIVTIDSIITMNLSANQRNGSLKLGTEKPVNMICNLTNSGKLN